MQHNDAPGRRGVDSADQRAWTLATVPLLLPRQRFRVALSALGRGFPVCPSRAADRVWTLPTTPWTLPTRRHRKINELPNISRGLCRTNK
jgi:hypothetical protein